MKRSLIVAVLTLAALGASACSRYLTAGAALVNGVSIPQSVVDERLEAVLGGGGAAADERRAELSRDVVGDLVREEVVRQEVERQGIEVTAEEVEEQLSDIKSRFPDEEAYRAALEQEGLTEEVLRERLREFVGRERLTDRLTEGDPVTSAEILESYRRNEFQYREYRLRQILLQVPDPAQEQEVVQRIQALAERIAGGEAFAEVAREASEDTSSKESGGDLGWQRLSSLNPPQLGQAASLLEEGQVSDPVRSALGYHLLQVVGIRQVPIAQVRDEIAEQISRQKRDQALGEWLQDALQRATIRINPQIGDWDEATNRVVPHQGFVPASPATDVADVAPPPGLPGS